MAYVLGIDNRDQRQRPLGLLDQIAHRRRHPQQVIGLRRPVQSERYCVIPDDLDHNETRAASGDSLTVLGPRHPNPYGTIDVLPVLPLALEPPVPPDVGGLHDAS